MTTTMPKNARAVFQGALILRRRRGIRHMHTFLVGRVCVHIPCDAADRPVCNFDKRVRRDTTMTKGCEEGSDVRRRIHRVA